MVLLIWAMLLVDVDGPITRANCPPETKGMVNPWGSCEAYLEHLKAEKALWEYRHHDLEKDLEKEGRERKENI